MSATAEPDEPLPATADVSPHADEASPPPARFDVLNAVRVVVGAFGLAGFVLGAIVAWRSASATTLLIVSAVLLVLAALGLDWNKIRGTYGGWTVELLRDFGERIEQVADKAAIEEVTPALREELETLRAEVKALAPKAPPRRSSQGSSFNFDAMIRELFRTKATHSFRGTDAVELTLRHGTSDARYRCSVTTPTGNAYTALPRPSAGSFIGARMHSLLYPDEFEGSEPLVPGRYTVEWRTAPLDPGVGDALVRELVQAATPPVATHSFTIPERRTGAAEAGSS